MSEGAAPAAPAPTSNGASAQQPQGALPPKTDTATGPQTPASGPVRGPDGKFTSAKPPEAPQPKPKIKIKEQEFDEESAWAEIQRGRSASKLLTEAQKRAAAADAREKAEADRRAKYKEDLGALFEELGLTAEQEKALLAKRLYGAHIEPQTLSEEQRQLREAQKKLADYEAKEKATREKADEDARRHAIAEEAKGIEAEIRQAAEAGKIPSSALGIRRIAEKMGLFESRGQRISAEQAALLVREDLGKELGEFSSETTLEQRRELWGDAAFKAEEKKWAAHFFAQVRQAPDARPQSSRPSPPKADAAKRMTPQEFLQHMRKR